VEKFKNWIEVNLNIVCLDNSSLKVASTIYSDLRKRGELIKDPNLLIASICIANDLSLMTGNKKHFERLKRYGLKLI